MILNNRLVTGGRRARVGPGIEPDTSGTAGGCSTTELPNRYRRMEANVKLPLMYIYNNIYISHYFLCL